MAGNKVAGWFTVNGKHIPVMEGESKSDAFKRQFKDGKSVKPKSTKDYKKLQPTTKEAVEHYDKANREKTKAESAAYKKWKDMNSMDNTPSEISKAYEQYQKANKEATASYRKFTEESEKSKIKSVKVHKKSVAEQNEDIKEKQIAKAQAERDRLNSKPRHKALDRVDALNDDVKDKNAAWSAANRDLTAALSNKQINLAEYLEASKKLKSWYKKWFE